MSERRDCPECGDRLEVETLIDHGTLTTHGQLGVGGRPEFHVWYCESGCGEFVVQQGDLVPWPHANG